MVYDDEYEYFLKELTANEGEPYCMSNRELAIEIFDRYKKDNPDAGIYCYDISQYICKDRHAKIRLAELLDNQRKRQAKELQATVDLLRTVEREANIYDSCDS